MSQEPTWLNSLSTKPAPDVPGAFLHALRERRRERRQRVIAGGGLALVIAIAIGAGWLAFDPSSPVRTQIPIAIFPEESPKPMSFIPTREIATAASIYAADDLASLDRLASAASSDAERLRIGDHWDPERVKAWVLD